MGSDVADPWELMRANELAATEQDRADRGAWYTPRPVAEEITRRAFDGAVPRFVVDPTCGGGAFVVAALDALVERGVAPAEAVGRVAGIDVDADAVATARAVVRAWAARRGVADVDPLVVVGDALEAWPADWPDPDLVLGNPPFASPLRASKARSSAELPPAAVAFRERHRDVLGPYADLAAVHVWSAAQRVDRTHGRLAMVLPQSMMAGRDAASLRERLTREFPLIDLWISQRKLFDASVRVFAPVLARTAPQPSRSWAATAATAVGLPDPQLSTDHDVLGSICSATAGFRDEYYGLVEACVEGAAEDDRVRLATVGSVDPLEFHWGVEPIRFAKSTWVHPVIDERRLDPGVRGWFERQKVPKVLLPTQSRVLEPFVDRTGAIVPVTPLLSISAASADLDLIAAVLLAPAVSAWAARRSFGTALSVSAIKLRAADVVEIPLPGDRALWDEAAALVTDGPTAIPSIADLMDRAYGVDDAVGQWWSERRR